MSLILLLMGQNGDNALMVACQCGHLHVAKMMIDKYGLDVNEANKV